MAFLIDTSILGRLANSRDSSYSIAVSAILRLHRRGESLHIAPQNIVEFRNVATRPALANGLGLTITQAEMKITAFETAFALVEENPNIYPAWKILVQTAGVIGKQVHDARLVAICQAEGISHLLTFNTSHFTTIAAFVPSLTIVAPVSV